MIRKWKSIIVYSMYNVHTWYENFSIMFPPPSFVIDNYAIKAAFSRKGFLTRQIFIFLWFVKEDIKTLHYLTVLGYFSSYLSTLQFFPYIHNILSIFSVKSFDIDSKFSSIFNCYYIKSNIFSLICMYT